LFVKGTISYFKQQAAISRREEEEDRIGTNN